MGWFYLCKLNHLTTALSSFSGIRNACREAYKIDGNLYEDFFACLLLYPLAAVQVDEQVALGTFPEEDDQEVRVRVIVNPRVQGDIPMEKVPYERNGLHQEPNGPPSYAVAVDVERKPMDDDTNTAI